MKTNKNRIILLAILGMFLLWLVPGCPQTSEVPSEDIVVEFFEYLYDGDSGSAQALCTERALDQEMERGGNAFNHMRDEYSSGDNIYIEAKLVADVRGNTAEVWSRDDEDLRIILIKVGNVWKIDEFEFRSPARDDRDDDRRMDDDEDEENGDEDDGRRRRDRDGD